MICGSTYWPRAFESFVLNYHLHVYKVTKKHIQICSMNISRHAEKSGTIEKLFIDNRSVIKSLKMPADIKEIRWNKGVGPRPIESASVTITFTTAQQANEAIYHGLLWKDERRICRKQGPHPWIIQCRNCQAYGHFFKDCSLPPRCHVCAGTHISTTFPCDPTDKTRMKCALSMGAHDATDEDCPLRKAERRRLQLVNRYYATGAA